MGRKKGVRRLFSIGVDVFSRLSMLAVVYVCVQVFLFASFKIPSDSMAPSLTGGDNVPVFKPTVGARLFDLFASMRGEQVKIHRTPEIRNGFYRVRGVHKPLGNIKSLLLPCCSAKAPAFVWLKASFVHNFHSQFSILNSQFNEGSLAFRFDVAKDATPNAEDSVVYPDNQAMASYRFQKNCYFVAGDYTEDSRDSRYRGLLPEEYIVGKAWMIWRSIDPHTGKFRKERFLKAVK